MRATPGSGDGYGIPSVDRVRLRSELKTTGTRNELSAEELGRRISIECGKNEDGIAPVQALTIHCGEVQVRGTPPGVLAILSSVNLNADPRLMYMLAGAIPVYIYDRVHPEARVRTRPPLAGKVEKSWYELVAYAEDAHRTGAALSVGQCNAILAVEALR